MKKQISAAMVLAAFAALGACGTAPTDATMATPTGWHADEAPPQDTTSQRIPNMMGSGN